jgi:hypothetical protein
VVVLMDRIYFVRAAMIFFHVQARPALVQARPALCAYTR